MTKSTKFWKAAVVVFIAAVMTIACGGYASAFDPVKLNTSSRVVGLPSHSHVIFDAVSVSQKSWSDWSDPVDVREWGNSHVYVFAYANGTVSGYGNVTATYQCGILDSGDDSISWYYPFLCANSQYCTATRTSIGTWTPGDGGGAGFGAGEGYLCCLNRGRRSRSVLCDTDAHVYLYSKL